jgi:hypothetical protein
MQVQVFIDREERGQFRISKRLRGLLGEKGRGAKANENRQDKNLHPASIACHLERSRGISYFAKTTGGVEKKGESGKQEAGKRNPSPIFLFS